MPPFQFSRLKGILKEQEQAQDDNTPSGAIGANAGVDAKEDLVVPMEE